jgi:hypothetical protein
MNKPTVEQFNRKQRMMPQGAGQQEMRDPEQIIEDFSLSNFSAMDLNKIMAGLGHLPFKDVIGLVRKIEEQINAYNVALAQKQVAERAAANAALEDAADKGEQTGADESKPLGDKP